ncbi:hypothetical protein N8T08_010826 [Aspergillus melleus]|uniref:Uncharacterized protein n=1 Tax=Aspergillus melleus TaxID=138277 RepID=A0ACC3BC94_9EURO|nr:hypothetical protein N8T08_010826 [Aspergillus melleus]
MFFQTWLATLPLVGLLAGPAGAINLTYYQPQGDVDPAFANWIGHFYGVAELSNPQDNGFMDYFAPDHTIELGGWNQTQDSVDGLKLRSHFPAKTVIDGDFPIQKTYHVYGLTKGYYKNGSCQVESYETKFYILKNNGKPLLEPKANSIVNMELVEQTVSPLACDSY